MWGMQSYFEVLGGVFSFFLSSSRMASSNSLPKDLPVSTARCFNSLIRSSSTLVENIFFLAHDVIFPTFFWDIARIYLTYKMEFFWCAL